MIKYYCIHHDLAIDRKQYITTHISLPNLIWITDYKPLSGFIQNHPKIYCEHSANKEYLNKAELSCYYKHCLAIRNIANSHEYGFVFEDDIEKPSFDILDMTQIFIDHMTKNSVDILFVGSFASYDLPQSVPFIVCNEFTKSSRCAHAYILNPKTASQIKDKLTDIKAPFDWQLNYLINEMSLKSCWSYPHIYQRTEKNLLDSLIR